MSKKSIFARKKRQSCYKSQINHVRLDNQDLKLKSTTGGMTIKVCSSNRRCRIIRSKHESEIEHGGLHEQGVKVKSAKEDAICCFLDEK